jgi:Txe/YoeB family toxin of Txe-Axe toxin-antitoxin module
MSIEVVLRTCDHSNVHKDWRVRYSNIPKNELVIGCVNSLINSCKDIENLKFTVFDDHSSKETIDKIIEKLENNKINYEFISLGEKGYNYSGLKQWERCRDSECDLVYSIEDDYLHCQTAVKELIDSYYLFCDRLKKDTIVLTPFDEPGEYNPPQRKDFIVHGSNRHWRTGINTSQVLFCKPKVFGENWDIFELLATKYNGNYLESRTEHYEESNTIWKLWSEGPYIRFNPIPSLALHMQFNEQIDPFIDWKKWWKEYNN